MGRFIAVLAIEVSTVAVPASETPMRPCARRFAAAAVVLAPAAACSAVNWAEAVEQAPSAVKIKATRFRDMAISLS